MNANRASLARLNNKVCEARRGFAKAKAQRAKPFQAAVVSEAQAK